MGHRILPSCRQTICLSNRDEECILCPLTSDIPVLATEHGIIRTVLTLDVVVDVWHWIWSPAS